MKGKAVLRSVAAAALAVALLMPVSVRAQGNSALAGSWALDTSKVEATVRAAGPGRAGGPPASKLVITIDKNEVSVASDTGTNRAMETAVYKLTGPEQKVPGPLSWTTLAKAAWEGETLVVNIARIIEGPGGDIRIEMKDVYRVNGNVLTLERFQGPDSWRSLYNKAS
jgi:hypothetical protein